MTRKLVSIVVFAMYLTPSLCAEMVTDSNSAYFPGERLDIVISAPRGFQLITTEAQRDGFACAIIPSNEEYATASLSLGIHFFRIRGMSFGRALSQDTSNLRSVFGDRLSMIDAGRLPMLTFDSILVIKLSNADQMMHADFLSYFDAGTDMLVLESSRTALRTVAESERLLRETTALAKVLTRAENREKTSKP